MCLMEIVDRHHSVPCHRERKKISLIRDGGIGYKVFAADGSSYFSAESHFNENWKKAYNNPLYALNAQYTSGFHLFYNLAGAIDYGKRIIRESDTFYISILEYKDILAIGYESNHRLCIVADKVRLIRHRAYTYHLN